MRHAALATLIALLLPLSAYAQALGSCAPELIGSPSCPYQWVGATTVSFTGDGNGLGFVGMTTQCRADFGPGSRMCTSSEIINSDTLNPNSIPAQGCWVKPSPRLGDASALALLDDSGIRHQYYDLNCLGWRSSSSNFGLTLTSDGVLISAEPAASCSAAKPIACCKPIAVGEPQASMMLPAGVGVLAALSSLRGAGL